MYLILPYPPTINTCWRSVNGRNILSPKARKYIEDALWVISEQRIPRTLASRVGLTIKVLPPNRRRRQVDSILRPVFDALWFACVYEDSAQVDRLEISKEPEKYARIEVEVREL